MLRVIKATRPDVFLPIGTVWVSTASKHRERLAALTAVNVVGPDAFMAAFDKAACLGECRRLGIPCPSAYALEEALTALDSRSGETTLVVKPRWDIGAASGVRYVRDRAALYGAVEGCTREFGDCPRCSSTRSATMFAHTGSSAHCHERRGICAVQRRSFSACSLTRCRGSHACCEPSSRAGMAALRALQRG